jgi:hypothetical protein
MRIWRNVKGGAEFFGKAPERDRSIFRRLPTNPAA